MSTSSVTNPIANPVSEPSSSASLLVCLPSVTTESAVELSRNLVASLPEFDITFSGPGLEESGDRFIPYSQPPHGDGIWAVTGKDYLAASQLALENSSAVTLVLGAEASSLQPDAIRTLVHAVAQGTDFAVPRYATGPHEALVSSAILGPMTRALYGVQAHLPLPVDACFSLKMAQRLSMASKKIVANNTDVLVWPVSEAAVIGASVKEIYAGHRTLPPPQNMDLNSLLAQVLGSFFADTEAKAATWQRSRVALAAGNMPAMPLAADAAEYTEDLEAMLASFRNAYDNLQEIWALVLPPQSLLRVKRLSQSTLTDFAFPSDLWARTMYDFLMAFRLRSINRGHLLGAMTPLYLAWVASHLHTSRGAATRAVEHVEETTAAFVTEKPYLVSRWRWPDRFNP